MATSTRKIIQLDGSVGEGGGQLVRVAVCLSAVLGQPVRIINVRGNRGTGVRGGGLKSQHVTAIEWLAQATDAQTEGLHVGSSTLVFHPRLPPTEVKNRKLNIVAESPAASALLIVQCLLPFFLFAAGEAPLEVDIHGGTNVSWSLSFEYFDQVLLPTLQDRFGVVVERKLVQRGWSQGSLSRGCLHLKVQPIARGGALKLKNPQRNYEVKDFEITRIDASIIVPAAMQEELQNALARDLQALFPQADLNFVAVEDSHHEARVYALLVARSETLRWGRDILNTTPKKGRARATFVDDVSRKLSKELYEEVEKKSILDEFLEDQLIIYQALAEGRTSFPKFEEPSGDTLQPGLEESMAKLGLVERMRKDKTHEPFGEGSLHAQTARWVVAELLPTVVFYNKGSVCDGAGVKFG